MGGSGYWEEYEFGVCCEWFCFFFMGISLFVEFVWENGVNIV